MSDELRLPVIEEQAHVTKRVNEIDRLSVRTLTDEREEILRHDLARERVEVSRVAIGIEVAEAPPIRTEGDLTIVPVVEERLVVEKRLFLVEEVHLLRVSATETVEQPVTLRRTRVEIDRVPTQQEKI